MAGLRVIRLAEQIRDILAECFQGGVLNDPRLADVTITAVKLSADLQIATVYFRVYLDADRDVAKQGLVNASGFLKHRLAESLDIRRVPELRFFYDESVERGARVEQLLDELGKKKSPELETHI